MRYLSYLGLVIFLAGCTHIVPTPVPPAVDHTITFTFNQSFANNGACSTTVTTSCISGFNEGYLSGSTQVQLNTALPSVCTGTTQPETCTSTFNGVLPIGSLTFFVSTTYINASGVAGVTTADLSSPVNVAADPATNLNVTVQ